MHNKPLTFADITKLVMVRNSWKLFGYGWKQFG